MVSSKVCNRIDRVGNIVDILPYFKAFWLPLTLVYRSIQTGTIFVKEEY